MSADELITQRQYFETRLQAEKELVVAWRQAHAREHELLKEALTKAQEEMDRRLQGMNEFRAQLDRQAASFVTREMFEPLQRFHDRFIGILLGLTILNGLVTYLIVSLLRRG